MQASESKPGDRVIGKWERTDRKETLEFLKDGDVRGLIASDAANGTARQESGTYFVDEDTASISLRGHDPMTWKLKCPSRDGLIVTFTRLLPTRCWKDLNGDVARSQCNEVPAGFT